MTEVEIHIHDIHKKLSEPIFIKNDRFNCAEAWKAYYMTEHVIKYSA